MQRVKNIFSGVGFGFSCYAIYREFKHLKSQSHLGNSSLKVTREFDSLMYKYEEKSDKSNETECTGKKNCKKCLGSNPNASNKLS